MNGDVAKRLSRLVFLGTGTSQGVPVIGCGCDVCRSEDPKDQRLRSSLWVQQGETSVVVDTGPDFRHQMLRSGCTRLDAVVYTHEHKDHVAGMDDVRPFNYRQKQRLPLYASERVEATLRRDFHYAFHPASHGGVPHVELRRVAESSPFVIEGVTWQPLPVMHAELPVHGYRVEDVAYITDANAIPEATFALLEGVDTLVLNALRPQPHYSHFSLEEAVDVAHRVGARQTWFTHVSHLMPRHAEAEANVPSGMRFAYDGLTLERRDGHWVEVLNPASTGA